MALPYLLSSEEYFNFNTQYYVFSLLVVLSGFGFEFAYYRFPTSLFNLGKLILLNSSIFVTILYFGGLINCIDFDLLIILFASFVFIVFNVFQFTLLFNKQKKEYFVFSLIFYSIFLISIPTHLLFGIKFFYSFSLFAGFGFLFAMLFVYKTPENSNFRFRGWNRITQLIPIFNKSNKLINKEKEFALFHPLNKYYQIGFNALIINGFITLVLSINHLTANILFEKETANTIIIAWLFTFPILHAGNIAEKVFYNSKNLIAKYQKWVSILFVGVLGYILIFFLALEYVPSLFPKMISKDVFFNTTILLLPIMGIYSIFNAPLNAFVFKYLRAREQRFITIYLGSAIVVLFFLSMYNINSGISSDGLLLKSLSFFVIPIVVKFFAVGRALKNMERRLR